MVEGKGLGQKEHSLESRARSFWLVSPLSTVGDLMFEENPAKVRSLWIP